jgi:MoxR-like ATPase
MIAATISPQRFHELAHQIESEVSKVIVGQHDIIRQTLISIVLGRHTLLEGVRAWVKPCSFVPLPKCYAFNSTAFSSP